MFARVGRVHRVGETELLGLSCFLRVRCCVKILNSNRKLSRNLGFCTFSVILLPCLP